MLGGQQTSTLSRTTLWGRRKTWVVPGGAPTSSRRQLAIEAAKSLAMGDCTYAGGVRLAVEAASTRSSPLRAMFTAQPAVKTKGYEDARMEAHRFQWIKS